MLKSNTTVLKWWRHNNEISEIMGFVRILWKNIVQEAHFGANCLWDVSQLYSENSIQTLLIFRGVVPKKFRRVCMEFSKHNWATISETICPEMLIFGKYASWTLLFQNMLVTNPIISEISFLWRHTLVFLCYWCNYKLNGVLLFYVHFYIIFNLVCRFYYRE